MRAKFNRWMHLLSFALIGLLGFSACSEEVIDDPNKGGYDMYGSPTTDFIVTGRVTDEDGKENGGEFLNDTLRYPEFERTLLEKGSGWYEGLYELKAEVKLIKKE